MKLLRSIANKKLVFSLLLVTLALSLLTPIALADGNPGSTINGYVWGDWVPLPPAR